MNVLFLVKFYEPFDRGGSEWSTHDLAKLLVKKGHKVTILTPNYGAKAHQVTGGIKIERFPFLRKLKNPKAEITPWWTNNIFWFAYTSLLCIWYVIKEKFDVIHVHSNEFLPAAVITQLVTKKPAVATFRDYQVICNFGFCLWHNSKACNFKEYLESDFKFFYENYIENKNIAKYLILYLAAIRSRIITKILFYFVAQIKYKVAVSKHLAEIFKANDITKMAVIRNPVLLSAPPAKAKNGIVYIGKFSKGKGPDLLMEAVPQIIKKFPDAKFKFVGSGNLGAFLKKRARVLQIKDKVVFTGRVDHARALSIVRHAELVVVPSIWPEPLPRSVIETILAGTPVVATNVGGIGEILENKSYGILADPTISGLKIAVIKGFKTKEYLQANILKDLKALRRHFSEESVNKYLEIYQKAQ